MKQKENSQVRDRIIAWCKLRGIPCINSSSVGQGVADLIICYKGHYLEVECKTVTGTVRGTQSIRKRLVEDNHGTYIVARSLKEFVDTVYAIEIVCD